MYNTEVEQLSIPINNYILSVYDSFIFVKAVKMVIL